MIKPNVWYKVFYIIQYYNGDLGITFEYAMNDQVKALEDKFKDDDIYVRTEEWKV